MIGGWGQVLKLVSGYPHGAGMGQGKRSPNTLVPVTHHLVGPAEIAELLGVTPQRVHQLSLEDPKFPKPAAELATGRVWTREAVEKWAKATGRAVTGL